MSPYPNNCSAPPWSKIVLESIFVETWKAILVGIFALIKPVMTSTEGLWVANIRWIPAALAFCAILAIRCSTFFPTNIIMSANSSTTTTIDGNTSRYSSSFSFKGFNICFPFFSASRIFLLNPAKFLTPIMDINLYLLSISATHHLKPLDASVISVITGVSKWGIPS